MPPAPLVDLRKFDLDHVEFGREEIRRCNPHRFEFELLSAVIAYGPDEGIIVGVCQTSRDDFWVRGHIPGRPLFPGVLMIEAAAQLCSFYWRHRFPEVDRFFGFGGIRNTNFRGTVHPGDRIILAGKSLEMKPRRAIFAGQGFVGDTMVFDTEIVGLLV